MKPVPRQVKRRELTESERRALRSIDEGTPADPELCARLEGHGLVELKDNVWTTTQQGHFELMFQRAH